MLLINNNWYKCDDIPDIINILNDEYNQELAGKLKEFYNKINDLSDDWRVPEYMYNDVLHKNKLLKNKNIKLKKDIDTLKEQIKTLTKKHK